MVETIPLEKPIYCAWVDMEVEHSLLGKRCDEFIFNCRCTNCQRSVQLDYGGDPVKLLEQLRACDPR